MWTWRKREEGQASAEYLGVVVIVALLIAALAAVVLIPGNGNVSQDLHSAVCRVHLTNCDDGGGTDGGDGAAAKPATGAGAQSDSQCHGFAGCAWNGVKQVGSGVYNIGKGAVDDVTGLIGLIAHPGRIADAGKYIWNHPLDAVKQLVWDDESAGMWGNGDYGGAIGRTIWNVGSWFIPFYDIGKAGSKLGELGKLGRLGEAADKVADLGRLADDAGRLAREAETAAARGDVAAAEKAARQARADAEAAKARARKAGCAIAFGRSGHGGTGRLGVSTPVLMTPPRGAGPGGCDDAADAARKADEAADAAEATARAVGVVTVPTDTVRFSQSSVNGAAALTESMKAKGWVGDPIDVIKMPDGGLTSVDNTRVLAAHQAGIDVQARVHAYDDPLPPDLAQRFTTPKGGVPTTWGEAVHNRIGAQNSGYRSTYPNGSPVTGWNGN